MREQRRISWWWTAAIAVLLVALALGVFSFFMLDEDGSVNLWLEVGKLAFQAFAIVLLGFLLKTAIDDSKDRAARRESLNRRRSEYIRRLIDVSHTVESARSFIIANRSVKTWDAQMQQCVAAYVELRDIRHDVKTDTDSGQKLFENWNDFQPAIKDMEAYLKALIDEYADNKKRLSELQIVAERHRNRQDEVWSRLNDLCHLHGLIDGATYWPFRDHYWHALTAMRSQLSAR